MRSAPIVRLFCFLLTLLACAAPAAASVVLPDFADLAENSGKAVVNISTAQKAKPSAKAERGAPRGGQRDPFEEFFDQFERFFGERGERAPRTPQRSLGSGFVISADGYVVTNNHVVEGADEIRVSLQGVLKPYAAKLVGRDAETDLALLKIDAGGSLPFLRFGDSEKMKIGQWVVAIGNPFGLDHSVTAGIISAKSRVIGAGPFDNFLQTDASINPGNSGGPLLNLRGEVIGINTAILATGQGIGFAIPSEMASRVIEQLRTNQRVQRGWLGVSIQNLDENTGKALGLPNAKGALVASVMPGEPGAKAGLQAGDVVTAVGGQAVEDASEFLRRIAALKPGDKAVMDVWRGGQKSTVTAILGERDPQRVAQGGQPEPDKSGQQFQLGLALRPVQPNDLSQLGLDRPQGLLVLDVADGSPAEQAGIRQGDVILQANQQPVRSVEELKRVMDEQAQSGVLLLLLKRQGQNVFRSIPLKGAGQ